MTLVTPAHRQKLLENGRAQRAAIDSQDQVLDFELVVKLTTADGNTTWPKRRHDDIIALDLGV
jgi:hypothetical protein